MFRIHRFVLVSRSLLQLAKIVKHPENVLKFSRILSSSGCLIAGCCFSRQSDEEALLDGVKDNHENFPKIENKSLRSNSNLEEHASHSKNMKRSFESINDITVQVSDACENSVRISNVYSKKKKTYHSEATHEGSIQQELPDTVCDSSAHTSTDPPEIHPEKSKIETEKPKKLRPNYFVAVKISDDQILQALTELQAHIVQKDERLKRSMIELKTLHITLMVMHIGDPETHTRAMRALENIHQEHDEDMSKNPVKLEFRGLGHFQNRVLYAKLSMDDSYQRLRVLAESVKKHFASASIFSTDSRQDFTPHLTVAKIDFKKRQNKFVKKINPSFYKDFSDQYFGSQKISSIQLLSMLDPKDEVGYYSGNEIYFSAFNPSARRNSLNTMLETEEKKKNVKEIINALMREKLK